MKFDPEIHHRRSIRLKAYDYAWAGAYFVTICSREKEEVFGAVVDGAMVWNQAGEIIRQTWLGLTERFPNLTVDEFVVMPNHFHGILVIADPVGAPLAAPGFDIPLQAKSAASRGAASCTPTVGEIIRAFKSISANAVNRLLDRTGCPLWQRNYYERIIRNDDEWVRARQYIEENPMRWHLDAENPANIP